MIFHGELWSSQEIDEFYSERDFETELSRITIFDKTIFDFQTMKFFLK